METQELLILEHLKNHTKGITSKDAFDLYDITRLSAVIYNLRAKGVEIISIKQPNKSNKGSHARYVLTKNVIKYKEYWTEEYNKLKGIKMEPIKLYLNKKETQYGVSYSTKVNIAGKDYYINVYSGEKTGKFGLYLAGKISEAKPKEESPF